MNEQEIAGAVGSAALQRRRGSPCLWLSLERRGRMHLLLCADLVRFYREVGRGEGGGIPPGGAPSPRPQGEGGGGVAAAESKRKSKDRAMQDSQGSSSSGAAGGGGSRKRVRATDPWEDILGALNPLEVLGGRSSSVPGSSGSSSGR